MIRWAFLVLLLLGVAAATPSGRVRLCCWNLHNLFDSVDDSYADEVLSAAEVESALAARAAVIRSWDADVVGVEEVENLALLERLAAQVGGMRYALLVEGNDKQRGIDVGLLTRLPVVGYKTHKDDVLRDGIRYSRDCLEVHLGGPLPFVVLVNHFKSKASGGARSDEKRRAQAEGVAALVSRLGPYVAVIGDLNDGPGSWPLEPLSFLRDPFGGLTLEARATHVHRGKPGVLDHILLTPALYRYVVPGSARVYRGKAVKAASDHGALRVDLGY